jgi:hypothetical protein
VDGDDIAEDSGEVAGEGGALERIREGLTMAFYVTICLLAALAAVRHSGDEGHVETLRLIWGTTIGLAFAHWFAFRLAAKMAEPHHPAPHNAALLAAQMTGAAAVALVASIPVLLLPGDVELKVVRWELAGLLGLAGYTIARSAGSSRGRSIRYGLSILGLATVVVLVKSRLGH